MIAKGYLTISIDDGHPTDLRTAEMLARWGLRATFYIPGRNQERRVMAPTAIRELAQAFEIGAHTMNHKRLARLVDREARAEIAGGKKWLEDLLSSQVDSFCYPGGKYNRRIIDLVRHAGFLGARTCDLNLNTTPSDPFRWGVSTQAYSHTPGIQILHALRQKNFAGTTNYFLVHRLTQDWETHFLRSLDWVEARGGIAHLYMHSWEIDSVGHWDKLSRVLSNAASRKTLIRATNGALFARWYHQTNGHEVEERGEVKPR